MACEDHPKLNWAVGCSGLSTHFLVACILLLMISLMDCSYTLVAIAIRLH